MFFKKYKVKKTNESSKVVPYTFGIIGVFLIFFIGVKAIDAINTVEFQFTEFAPKYISNMVSKTPNSLGTDQDNLNILILGRGGGDHDAPDLTDTIILASIDNTKDVVTLLSIPRDLYVRYPDTKKKTGKINRIYETYKPTGEQIAIEKIQSKVTEITGQEIDYYVNVDFEGFVEIVNILGGVEVTLEENLVDNEYPTADGGWTTFILRKGTWTLDGDVALKYARSRHSTSDFDRSLRQQQILSSLKNRVLSLGYFKDNKKIRELYGALEKYIETDIDLTTLLKLAAVFKSGKDKKILSFNLNDSCFPGSPVCGTGGLLYVPFREIFGGQSVLLVEGSDASTLSNYEKLEVYTDAIFENQEIYTTPVSLRIYNTTKTKGLAGGLAETLKKYGILLPPDGGLENLTEKKFEKSILQYNGIEEDNKTLQLLKNTLGFELQQVPEPEFGSDDTRIEILLGEDFEPIEYLELRN